jgi:hypothetical protein
MKKIIFEGKEFSYYRCNEKNYKYFFKANSDNELLYNLVLEIIKTNETPTVLLHDTECRIWSVIRTSGIKHSFKNSIINYHVEDNFCFQIMPIPK